MFISKVFTLEMKQETKHLPFTRQSTHMAHKQKHLSTK